MAAATETSYNSFGNNLEQNIDWKADSISTFQKDFYVEHPDVTKMTDEEVNKIRTDGQMLLKGKKHSKASKNFYGSKLSKYVLDQVESLGFKDPRQSRNKAGPWH